MGSIVPIYPKNISYKVYIAGNWPRKDELYEYGQTMEKYGISVQARWLTESAPAAANLNDVSDEYLITSAMHDIQDVMSSHALVLFSNGYGSFNKGGGRFFEMGLAYSREIPIITVGDEEMIFQTLSRVEDSRFYTVPDLYAAISLLLTWANDYTRDVYRRAERQANRNLVNEMLLEATGYKQTRMIGV